MPELSAVSCVTAAPGLLKRAWPAEPSAAVYVPGTGRTHLVSALAFEVLSKTADGSWTLGNLASAIFGNETLLPTSTGQGCGPTGSMDTPCYSQSQANPGGEDSDDLAHLIESARGLVEAGLLLTVRCP